MSETIIRIENITKFYGKKCVLDNVSFEIKRGSVYGLLGRNGAGKSTLIKILTGFEYPTSGSASIFNCDCMALTPETIEKICYMVEDHHLYGYMRIKQLHSYSKPFYKKWSEPIFNKIIEYFELDKNTRIKHLSRGQKAQVNLALALSFSPELLILDDPMLGLDTSVRREFLEAIIEVIQRDGRTVLFSSHILNEVEQISDYIGIIEKGKLIVNCPQNVLQEKIKRVRAEWVSNTSPDFSNFSPNLISQRLIENEYIMTIADFDDSIKEKIINNGFKIIDVNAIPLEEIFLEYTVRQRLYKYGFYKIFEENNF